MICEHCKTPLSGGRDTFSAWPSRYSLCAVCYLYIHELKSRHGRVMAEIKNESDADWRFYLVEERDKIGAELKPMRYLIASRF